MHWLVSASARGALARDSAVGEGSVQSGRRLGRGVTKPHAGRMDRTFGVVKLLVLLAAMCLAARALPAAAAPIVWAEPSMVRVGPEAAAGTRTSIDLYAAKGESESFQIIVKGPTGGLTNVNVTPPNLGGPQTTLYREHYVYLSRGSADWATNRNKPLGAGWYPDGLIPFKNPVTGADLSGATLDAVPFSLAAGKNQPIWVDVTVPRSTAAGLYRGTFTVTSNQGQAQVTLNLTVWDFTLPAQPALQSSILYWTVRGQLEPERELLRNRLMPANITASDGTTLANEGLSAVNVGFWSGADGSTCTVSVPAPSSSTVASTAGRYPASLRKYAYTADEISGCSGLVPTMQAYASALHSAGVDQLITMPPKTDWVGIVDIWVELPKQYSASAVNAAIGRGESVWSYNCLQQDDYSPKWLLDYAPINYRIQPGFINQVLGMTGLLYWRADYWTSDPWNNVATFSASYPAEGLLVYPGQQVGISGVAPSMRLKYLRDGVDDYDYLQLLKERGDGDWALSVARSVGPDWTNWTRDPNAVEAARKQLGDRLSGSASPHGLSVSITATPTTIASGGTVSLAATASDTAGHGVSSWQWSDGAAGGSFSPSASAQNPSYTAPPNGSGVDRTVTLTVTATCSGSPAATGSDSATITEHSLAGHAVSVTASASPTTVASGGTTTLNASVSDSLGHSIATWQWSDGGAGGTFSPSASVRSPSYTAPGNASGATRTLTLTVSATCSGSPAVTGSDSATLTEQASVAHGVAVTASASPTSIASGGTVSLSASASDSQGHTGLAWSWSDNGAGGQFLPSAAVQNPTWVAPPNTSGAAVVRALTATATCKWHYPWVSGSAQVSVTEQTTVHAVTVTANGIPSTIESGATVTLSASGSDSQGHSLATWLWSDGGAGGSFSPSASVQNPIYTAPANTSGNDRVLTLTVSATCSGSPPATGSNSVTVTEHSVVEHTVSVTASGSPSTISSGGMVSLSASASDSGGHSGLVWSWSDNGAGGEFVPSAAVQNPTWVAPPNTSDQAMVRTLTVTATCKWYYPWVSATASTSVSEQAASHTVTVTASAAPSTVSPGGTVSLTASAFDSLGHSPATWSWSDGGAGGSFAPSASVSNPTYTTSSAPLTSERSILLSVTASCNGTTPASGTGTTTISVRPSTPDLSVTVESPVPAVVPSEGMTDLSATAGGSVPEASVSWRWDDGGANGQFLPGPTVRAPRYKAPKNTSGGQLTVTLTATGACSEPTPLADQDTTTLVIQPAPHEVIVRASSDYALLTWKGRVRLTATAEDSHDHGIASWHWSDGGAGGTFSPNASVPDPSYRASANDTPGSSVIALSVTATCEGPSPAVGTGYLLISVEPKPNLKLRAAGGTGSVLLGPGDPGPFTDVPGDFWAADSITACREAGIITGYPDGSYGPDLPVLRDQMAVYLARALAGGDDFVPSGPPEASFSDVQPDHWAYNSIEYVASLGIAGGLPDGGYHPAEPVNRAQMAAFIARGAAFRAGDSGLVSYQPPAQPTFTDVPTDFWAYSYIEYLAEAGVVTGYDGDSYRPEDAVNRAQAAVYLDRAFGLGGD